MRASSRSTGKARGRERRAPGAARARRRAGAIHPRAPARRRRHGRGLGRPRSRARPQGRGQAASPRAGPPPARRVRLLREAQALARLRHPNVVTVHDVGEERGRLFIAMELVEGRRSPTGCAGARRSWREILDRFRRRRARPGRRPRGRPGPPRLQAGQRPRRRPPACASSTSASPPAARSRTPSVADGVAGGGRHPADPHRRAGRHAGVHGARSSSGASARRPRSDQFSFCVALYEALYRRRPFAGDTVAELAGAIDCGARFEAGPPRSLVAILRRGLAVNPATRFPSMDALLRALGRVGRGRGGPRRRRALSWRGWWRSEARWGSCGSTRVIRAAAAAPSPAKCGTTTPGRRCGRPFRQRAAVCGGHVRAGGRRPHCQGGRVDPVVPRSLRRRACTTCNRTRRSISHGVPGARPPAHAERSRTPRRAGQGGHRGPRPPRRRRRGSVFAVLRDTAALAAVVPSPARREPGARGRRGSGRRRHASRRCCAWVGSRKHWPPRAHSCRGRTPPAMPALADSLVAAASAEEEGGDPGLALTHEYAAVGPRRTPTTTRSAPARWPSWSIPSASCTGSPRPKRWRVSPRRPWPARKPARAHGIPSAAGGDGLLAEGRRRGGDVALRRSPRPRGEIARPRHGGVGAPAREARQRGVQLGNHAAAVAGFEGALPPWRRRRGRTVRISPHAD